MKFVGPTRQKYILIFRVLHQATCKITVVKFFQHLILHYSKITVSDGHHAHKKKLIFVVGKYQKTLTNAEIYMCSQRVGAAG